jgi:two-component system chemotaxis response regulator CheB
VSLLRSAPVHFSRPGIDVLFASAALVFGRRTLAVILSGNGFDGSDGVTNVHDAGGVTYVLPASSIGAAVRPLVTLGAAAGTDDPPPPRDVGL